jgi:hypothetical protein
MQYGIYTRLLEITQTLIGALDTVTKLILGG